MRSLVFILLSALALVATGCDGDRPEQMPDASAVESPTSNVVSSPTSNPDTSVGDTPVADSGEIDADSDGFPFPNDCNDFDSEVNPGRPELANDRVDNNCDGIIDGPVNGAGDELQPLSRRCAEVMSEQDLEAGVINSDAWLANCGIDLIESLQDDIQDLNAEGELGRALFNRLGDVIVSLEAADADSATGLLREFQDELRYVRGINEGAFVYAADRLIARSYLVIQSIIDSGIAGIAPGPQQTNRLDYLGGPIIENPKIYITFWGFGSEHSTTTDPAGVNQVLEGFLGSIGGTVYLEPLGQYTSTIVQGAAALEFSFNNNPGMLKGVWYDGENPMPKNPTLSDIQAEVQRSIQHFGYDYDAIYYIATAPGRTWNVNACAYHGSTMWSDNVNLSAIFVDLPYQPEVCTVLGLSGADATTILAFHELVEAITDPRLGDTPPLTCPPTRCSGSVGSDGWPSNFGWLAPDGRENADMCGTLEGYAPLTITLGGIDYAIQAHWSNKVGACVYF